MYTIVPFRTRREISNPMNNPFDDRFFRSFFDMNDMVGSAGFRVDVKEQQQNYLYSERRTGHMERRFSLEGIRQEGITAAYQDGVLTITLPKAQPEQQKVARRIAISGSKQGGAVPVQGETHA